jgi:hypothetical protein
MGAGERDEVNLLRSAHPPSLLPHTVQNKECRMQNAEAHVHKITKVGYLFFLYGAWTYFPYGI